MSTANDPVRVETWQNVSNGRVVVMKFDRGGDIRHEMIRGGQKFTITPEERLLNMDRAASDQLDVFKNGFLSPVRLIDDVEDYQEIASNPNLLGESELREMFDLHWKTFESKLNGITNVTTVNRLFELADQDDVNCSMKQFQAVKARLNELAPELQATDATVEQVGHIRGEREVKGVTPS